MQKHKTQIQNQKSQLIYVILALFFGPFGIHNFYAMRWGRGLIQLFITLFTGFLGILITSLWSIINIFTINSDGSGTPFHENPVAKYICGILGVFKYFFEIVFWWAVLFGLMTGSIHSYQMNNQSNHWTVQEKTQKVITPEKSTYITTETIQEN